jgi:hypothetical protein
LYKIDDRCQTSRGVVGVGVGVGVAHLSESTRERLVAASHHQQQQQQQQQHLSYPESPNMSQHFIRQRRLSGRENPAFTPSGFGNVEYSSLGKAKPTCASNCGFSSGFGPAPMGESLEAFFFICLLILKGRAENTKGGRITVQFTSCLTGLD